jgi:sigma-B regulation protein RsbU (phosphoserine phosphatase)
MARLFKSFSAKLSLYLLLLTTGIFICIAAIFGHYSAKQANNHAVLYSSALLKTILDDTQLELNDVEHIVSIVQSQIEGDINNPQSIVPRLIDMINKDNLIMGGCVALEPGFYPDERPMFMEYVYIDERSRQIVCKHLDGSNYDYLHMDWYTEAIKLKKPIWSDPYIDTGGGDRLMTTYSMPLVNSKGEAYGVLTADISIEEFVNYVNSMRPYSDGYTFIIDGQGDYISHPDSTVVTTQNIYTHAEYINCPELGEIGRQMTAEKSGSAEFQDDGETMLACYAPLENTGWSACYVCPYSSILDSLGNVIVYVYLILLAGLVILGIFIRRIVLRQTRPMAQLTDAAYHISEGNFNVPLPEISTNDELQQLHDGFVYMQTSLKQYIEQLTEATRTKERIASELNIAHDIQMSLLPHSFSPFKQYPNLDLYAILTPAKEVGGDFYDFLFRDNKLYFTIGDVSGKGVPAALIMAITRSRFRIFCENTVSPAVITAGLNHALCCENDAFMFVTMFVGVLDLSSGMLTYCNAGHNPAVIIGANGECRFMSATPNLPIGIEESMVYSEQSEQLSPSDALLLYTDGLTEAERRDHEQYGENRMLSALASCSSNSAQVIIDKLGISVNEFIDGAEASDDLTLMCIRLTEKTDNTLTANNA